MMLIEFLMFRCMFLLGVHILLQRSWIAAKFMLEES